MLRAFWGGAVALAALAANASADLTIRINGADSYGNVGGEFNLTHTNLGFTPAGLSGSNPFETFCIEKTESIAFGFDYYACLNTEAVHGGAGGGDPDPLDSRTAYLYERFITGALAGYVYGVGDGGIARGQAADDLQAVMWYIEEEEPISWIPGDGSRRDQFYQDAVNNSGLGIGNVRILNLYEDAAGTIAAQDQLVLIPEPATMALLALGLVALRRR